MERPRSKYLSKKLGINSSTQKTDAGGLRVQRQPGLHSAFPGSLSYPILENKTKTNKNQTL
jgi:hypothetical protein